MNEAGTYCPQNTMQKWFNEAFPMRSKAACLKLLRTASDVPKKAVLPVAKVLECGTHRSSVADWDWLVRYGQQKQRSKYFSRCVQRRQKVLRSYCGKSLIYVSIEVKSSIFLIFIDPTINAAVFWE